MREGFSIGDRIVRRYLIPGAEEVMIVTAYDELTRTVYWYSPNPPEARVIMGQGPVEKYVAAPKLEWRITS